eukprot:GEMP01020238.1.p1 GENE.GEMP01020238.1~~GEMP01020238.1.p1  ORF type:complete len:416 (+),score=112.85 GEMP01020238.1:71-1318(+)
MWDGGAGFESFVPVGSQNDASDDDVLKNVRKRCRKKRVPMEALKGGINRQLRSTMAPPAPPPPPTAHAEASHSKSPSASQDEVASGIGNPFQWLGMWTKKNEEEDKRKEIEKKEKEKEKEREQEQERARRPSAVDELVVSAQGWFAGVGETFSTGFQNLWPDRKPSEQVVQQAENELEAENIPEAEMSYTERCKQMQGEDENSSFLGMSATDQLRARLRSDVFSATELSFAGVSTIGASTAGHSVSKGKKKKNSRKNARKLTVPRMSTIGGDDDFDFAMGFTDATEEVYGGPKKCESEKGEKDVTRHFRLNQNASGSLDGDDGNLSRTTADTKIKELRRTVTFTKPRTSDGSTKKLPLFMMPYDTLETSPTIMTTKEAAEHESKEGGRVHLGGKVKNQGAYRTMKSIQSVDLSFD